MKHFILGVIITTLSLTSCKKDDLKPGSYETIKGIPEINPPIKYVNGGTLNYGDNKTNELIGTTWVLTRVISGFATSYPNDTIIFISNIEYSINGGAPIPYNLTTGVASTNKTLTLNYFYPFGGSNYSAELGGTFIGDGEINQAEFINTQNITTTIKAWFKKQ